MTQSRRYTKDGSVKASVVFAGESFGRRTVNPPVTPLSVCAPLVTVLTRQSCGRERRAAPMWPGGLPLRGGQEVFWHAAGGKDGQLNWWQVCEAVVRFSVTIQHCNVTISLRARCFTRGRAASYINSYFSIFSSKFVLVWHAWHLGVDNLYKTFTNNSINILYIV